MSDQANSQGSLIDHLIELRSLIIKILIAMGIIFLPFAFYAKELFHYVAIPLLKFLPEDSSMIATEVTSTFLVPFKLSIFAALYVCIPFIFYQAWTFVAPGLYEHEKKRCLPFVILTTALFYFGTAFAYFVVFPVIFAFFTKIAPSGVMVMTDISHYLNFVLKLFLAFGCAFQIPVIVLVLVSMGLVSVQRLASWRPMIIVGAFVLGMLLTPPDILSQLLLAIPIWALFEIGLYVATLKQKIKKNA